MLKQVIMCSVVLLGLTSVSEARGGNLLTKNHLLVSHYISQLGFALNDGNLVDLKYGKVLFKYDDLELFLEIYDDVSLRLDGKEMTRFNDIGKIEFNRADYLGSMIASDPSFVNKRSLHQYPHYQIKQIQSSK